MSHDHHQHHQHHADVVATPIPETHHAAHTMMGHSMAFHFGQMETILFDFWMPNSVPGMAGSCFLVLLLCFLYETLKFLRAHRDARRALETLGVDSEAKLRFSPKITSHNLIDLPLYALQILLAYMLMLIFMTFNIWLCLAILVGESFSHLFYRIAWPHLGDPQTPCC